MRDEALPSRRSIAAALPVFALAGIPAAAHVAPCPAADDTALLDLGRQWLALHARHVEHWRSWQALSATEKVRLDGELDAECEAMSKAEWALEDRIHAMPAASLAGLAVKARIAAHEFDVEELDIAAIERAKADHAQSDCQAHAALSLALDVLRLLGAAS
jgi:hypothetical protein